MNDDRYIALLNAEIDGELSETERHELDACLEENSEARVYQAALRGFATVMNSVPEKMPAPSLRQKIIDQVELPARRVFRRRNAGRPLPRGAEFSLAFAAGVLLAVGVYQFVPIQYPAKDFAGMVGTIVGSEDLADALPDDTLALESDEVTAMVSMRHDGDVYEVEFDLVSDGPIDVEADLAGAGLEFGGFARQAAGINAFQVADGTVRVATEGTGRFALFLQKSASDPGETRVEIRLFAGDEQVYRGALTAP